MATFSVHFAIITPESAEFGDVDETGTIDTGLRLRDAIADLFKTRTNEVDGVSSITADCTEYPKSGLLPHRPYCTLQNGMEYRTCAHEERSISPDGNITAASWRRVLRLIGAM